MFARYIDVDVDVDHNDDDDHHHHKWRWRYNNYYDLQHQHPDVGCRQPLR
jgi:hypothetical protein